MPIKVTKNGLSGGIDRQKREAMSDFKERRHEAYRDSWVENKKAAGDWIPQAEFEELTGRAGRKDDE